MEAANLIGFIMHRSSLSGETVLEETNRDGAGRISSRVGFWKRKRRAKKRKNDYGDLGEAIAEGGAELAGQTAGGLLRGLFRGIGSLLDGI